MRTTAKKAFIFLPITILCSLSNWAGPPPGDGGVRFPPHAVVSGQALLDAGGFIGGLVGSPPPHITSFPASVRIYSRRTHQLVRTITTDSEGRFEVKLTPGEYRIIPDIIQNGHVVAPGDAQGIIIIGIYEAAPALEVTVKPNNRLKVTIMYRMLMGS